MLIASVPWRRNSLNRLLHEIAQQSVLPAKVHVVLDGWEVGRPSVDLSAFSWTTAVAVHQNMPAQGAGWRWRVAKEISPNDIICNLDDDVVIDREFLQRHLVALEGREVVCSGGYTPTGRFIQCTADERYDGTIICLQAGAFTFRNRVLRGLDQRPMAAELLGMLGDDEALIAAHLWMSGIEVWRADAAVKFDPLAGDPRSQFATAPGRAMQFRARLRQLTGWPWMDNWH